MHPAELVAVGGEKGIEPIAFLTRLDRESEPLIGSRCVIHRLGRPALLLLGRRGRIGCGRSF